MASNSAILQVGAKVDDVLRQLTFKGKADGVMTTSSQQTGQWPDRKRVHNLLDLVVNEAGWLGQCAKHVVSEKSGEVPRSVINEPVTEAVDENDSGQNDYTRPDMDNVEYSTGKGHASWSLTYDMASAALSAGEMNLGRIVQNQFAKAMGNDLAMVVIQGDTLLDKSTKMNRLLRLQDGLIKQALARGHVRWPVATTGKDFGAGMFDAMFAAMPDKFKHDSGLRWMVPSVIDQNWRNSLTTIGESPANQVGSPLRDQVITTPIGPPPNGIQQIIIPQIPTNTRGRSSVAAPTAVVDDADSTITVRVATVLADATDFTGRKVKITCKATGQSETLSVYREGGQNKIATAGSLGQGAVSTTASDYQVEIADLTYSLLLNPKAIALVFQNKVRSYKQWNQKRDRWEIDVYYRVAVVLYNEDGTVIQGGVRPQVQLWE